MLALLDCCSARQSHRRCRVQRTDLCAAAGGSRPAPTVAGSTGARVRGSPRQRDRAARRHGGEVRREVRGRWRWRWLRTASLHRTRSTPGPARYPQDRDPVESISPAPPRLKVAHAPLDFFSYGAKGSSSIDGPSFELLSFVPVPDPAMPGSAAHLSSTRVKCVGFVCVAPRSPGRRAVDAKTAPHSVFHCSCVFSWPPTIARGWQSSGAKRHAVDGKLNATTQAAMAWSTTTRDPDEGDRAERTLRTSGYFLVLDFLRLNRARPSEERQIFLRVDDRNPNCKRRT